MFEILLIQFDHVYIFYGAYIWILLTLQTYNKEKIKDSLFLKYQFIAPSRMNQSVVQL